MSGPRPEALEAALALLRELLERGDGQVAASTLGDEARARGISYRTMDRARAQLGCQARKSGRYWMVYLPERNVA